MEVFVLLTASVYRSGIGEWFFLQHMELISWFNVMTIHVIPFDRPRIVSGFTIIRHCQTVETRPILLEDHLCILSVNLVSSRHFTGPSAIGFLKCSPFHGMRTSFALSLRAWISDAFQLLNVCDQNISFPNPSPHTMHIQEIFQVTPSYHQVDRVLTGLSQKQDDIPSLNQTELRVLWMVLQIAD